MAKKIRWSAIVLILFIAIILSACDFNPKAITSLFASPTPTNTATPTSTSTPTATPLPPLMLSGCPLNGECPDAVNISKFSEDGVKPNIPVSINVPYDVPIFYGFGWVAADQDTLETNLRQIKFFFRLDGIRYDTPSMFNYGYAYDSEGNLTNNPGYWFGVVLTGWKIGEPHTIEYGYTINNAINDGWQDYSPQIVTYTVHTAPIFIPTATLTPTETLTPTPLPTRTPVPYTPRPTAVPATPTSACNADSSIEIDNSTYGTLTLFLSGPTDYKFILGTGSTTLNVCGGNYSFTAYGCGGASLDGTINSGESHEFYCS
jgi:Predicted solute binding protein